MSNAPLIMMSSENEPTEDAAWMARCRALAHAARQSGDAPVGAVIVRAGARIAEASEEVRARGEVTAHAELLAVRRACRALGTAHLAGCVLYTNVEPCWMCAFAIRAAGLARVVIGRPVADIGGVTSSYPILTVTGISDWSPPPEVVWESPDDNQV